MNYQIHNKQHQIGHMHGHIFHLRMPNGADYEGEVYEGKPHGRGKLKYSNSQRYEGDFFQGMKHGKGKYYYMKGQLYIGDWFQNKKHGKGQYFYKNGTIYTGEFADNKKHGHGRIEEPNSSYFDGEFFMNNKDKTGIYFDSIKNKKYLLVYDNGKLVNQREFLQQNEQELNKIDDEDSIPQLPLLKNNSTKKGRERDREILSQQVYNSNMYSSEQQIGYISQAENNSLKIVNSNIQDSNRISSNPALIAQNYIDPALLQKKINQWDNSDVSTWLNQIGFGDCIDDFKENNIQGDSLLVLWNEDLKQLGVNALGDRRILQRQIQFLRLIFKSQCLQDPIAEYPDRQINLDMIKDLQQIKERRQLQSKKLDFGSSSSSSLSSQGKEKEKTDKKQKDRKKNKMSMQSKVSQYLQNKGIKLTFLIPKDQIQILQPIGKGGYGQVFLGRWLGQQVAVKKYLKKQGFRNRHIGHFIQQVQVINKLQHPCIVLYMGMCIYDNQYAMVTEFLSGGSLFDYLHKKKQKLTEDLVVSICKDVSLGMAYLHQKNVLHCDLKSSNLLIDENWNVKLCDFGLSRINSTKNKKKNKSIRVGTPHWMAPQILKGNKYECPSDIYSFGVLLWQMMTGKIPYKDYSTAQIIGMVGNDENHHISIPDYPNKILVQIFLKCTEREPAKRPSFKQIVKVIEALEKDMQKQAQDIKILHEQL